MINFKIPNIYNPIFKKAASTPNSTPKANLNAVLKLSSKSTLNAASTAQPKLMSPLAQDYFEKTVSSMQLQWDNKRIEKVFDKTYNIFAKQNPIINELNYTKPKLNFNPKKSDSNNINNNNYTVASYNFAGNEIIIKNMDFFRQDLYLLKFYSNNNELQDIKVIPEKDLEYFEKRNKDLKIEKTKLTDSEKELFLSSTLAHELRHSIQYHLMASTKGSNKDILESTKLIKSSSEALIESQEQLYQLTNDETEKSRIKKEIEQDKLELEKLNYSINYKPKKLFNSNAKLKFSIDPKDNRYLSVRKHLNANKAKTAYENHPAEIDAFNYEAEFLISQKPIEPSEQIRANIIEDMCLMIFSQTNTQSLFK